MTLRHGRHFRAFLVMVLGLVVIAGCSGTGTEGSTTEPTNTSATAATGDTEPTATTEGEMEPVTISYLASQNWVLDSETALAEQFEAETGIHVDFQIIPADQYFSVLQTKLEAGGEGIDIFGGQSGKTDIALQLGVKDNAVPLSDE
ncbi:MAG: carbohydrate ABC transporter substrate-binding protein, partial [Acidimicrobiia bacterium]